jgi:hypothetical protein
MIEGGRRVTVRYALAAASLGVGLSQPGHLCAYLAQYGWQGFALSTQGVHAYFPVIVELSTAGLGGFVLLVVLGLGLGRMAVGHALGRTREPLLPAGPVLRLFLIAGAVQMSIYLSQETIENVLDRSVLDGSLLVSMLAWGAAGQLPLALLAALALRWLSLRLHVAVEVIRSTLAAIIPPPPEPVSIVVTPDAQDRESALSQTAPSAFRKRGPPSAHSSQTVHAWPGETDLREPLSSSRETPNRTMKVTGTATGQASPEIEIKGTSQCSKPAAVPPFSRFPSLAWSLAWCSPSSASSCWTNWPTRATPGTTSSTACSSWLVWR